MELKRQNKITFKVYPRDVKNLDKRGFYIRVYYGQKPKLDKKTKKPIIKDNGEIHMVSDKEEIYFSDRLTYPNPKNDSQRKQNKHIQEIIEQIASEYRIMHSRGNWRRGGLDSTRIYLMDYMINTWLPKKNLSESTRQGYDTLYKHFLKFYGRDIHITSLDRKICNDFYNYLQNAITRSGEKLSDSAYKKYMSNFKYYLEQIFNGVLIDRNSPAKGITVKKPKPKKFKVFLDKHELEQLEKYETKNESLKRAYLFASYSAITRAELENMKWKDFDYDKDEDSWFVNLIREKTGKKARLRVNKKAMSFILPKAKEDDLVFNITIYRYSNVKLKMMVLKAGITKDNITFHQAKNNFAALFYRKHKGNHLGSLMKYMQHGDLTTTQRYLASLLGTEMLSKDDIDF